MLLMMVVVVDPGWQAKEKPVSDVMIDTCLIRSDVRRREGGELKEVYTQTCLLSIECCLRSTWRMEGKTRRRDEFGIAS